MQESEQARDRLMRVQLDSALEPFQCKPLVVIYSGKPTNGEAVRVSMMCWVPMPQVISLMLNMVTDLWNGISSGQKPQE